MTDERDPRLLESVDIRYEKSTQNRIIHVSGIWGGLAPDGNVMMAMYAERSEFPEARTYPISPLGRLEDPPTPAGRSVVREIEVEAYMSLATARATMAWLQERIRQAEQVEELRAEIRISREAEDEAEEGTTSE